VTVTSDLSVKAGDLVNLDKPDPRYGHRTLKERTFGGLHGFVLEREDIMLTVMLSSGRQAGRLIRWPADEVTVISSSIV